MTTIDEFAWAAGFFEGEGTVMISGSVFVARLGNTDEEVLRRFADVLAIGTIYGPYEPYDNEHRKKPLWVWLAREEDALDALALMWRWLGSRRRRRAAELTGIHFHVFSRIATELLVQRTTTGSRSPADAA